MFKKDSFAFGIVLGIIAPILSVVIFYFWKFSPTFSWGDYFNFLATNGTQLTSLSVPFLVLNIALFTIYINRKVDKTAKGIFAVTLLIALITLLVKFFY